MINLLAAYHYLITENSIGASFLSSIEAVLRQSVDEVDAGLIPSHPKLLLLGTKLLDYCKHASTVRKKHIPLSDADNNSLCIDSRGC